jgi:nucleotide-binding universal stress UspA family protein
MLPIKTILHPTDFSERSDAAYRLAGALARDYDARLVIVHVAEPPVAIYGPDLILPPTESYEQPLRAKLQELTRRDPTIRVEERFVEGDPAKEILRVAKETQCDLIVMGTHGRTGLGRLLMGSVAEQVVRKARCPVLTVKTPLADASVPGKAISEAISDLVPATK